MIEHQSHDTYRAVSLGIDRQYNDSKWSASESLAELHDLAKTADLFIVTSIMQKRENADQRYYLGKGKINVLADFISDNDIHVVLVDDELTPNQQKGMEAILEVKVVDRTSLILDIFARRAQTYEAKLQIELAQLEYMLPRLTRLWTHLSRQAGGIGSRGPGETQLEVDKREINRRISRLKKKIDKVKQQRHQKRQRRGSMPILTASLVGYTNAGKSTLLNALTESDVLSEDKLFATLDPTTRFLKLPSGDSLLLTDTVGFIQKLPHQLISAFRSTLEEVIESHIILHVVDVSHPKAREMIETVHDLLRDLNADHIPQLYVFNKRDQLRDFSMVNVAFSAYTPQTFVSAKTHEFLNDLRFEIMAMVKTFRQEMHFIIPYHRMDIVHLLHEHGQIISETYHDHIVIDISINRVVGEKIASMLAKDK